jgi:Flp pilus assembly protein TadD
MTRPFLCAAAVSALAFGAPAAALAAAASMTPVPSAPTPAPATATKAPADAPKRTKATAEERAAAERMPALARAAFWAREVDVDPLDVVAEVRLASALRALGQYDQAVQTVGRVLIIDPKNYDALVESARDYIASGQGFYAIDPLTHAQALKPKDWLPPSLLGVAYAQVKRDDDARAVWAEALKLSPNNPAVLSNMAMQMAAKGDAAGAEALLRVAVAQPDASLQVRQNLTLVLGIEGKFDEAETWLRRDLPPDQADADLAYLQTMSGKGAAQAPAQPPSAHSWQGVGAAGG